MAANTRLSAGPPSPPDRPATAVAPSTVLIMLTSTQRAPGRSSPAYTASTSTSSAGIGNSWRTGGSMSLDDDDLRRRDPNRDPHLSVVRSGVRSRDHAEG